MICPATDSNITKAAKLLQQGEVIGFPTETVYGLGANAYDEAAVAKIFELKNRPPENPLIIHLYSVYDLARVADLNTNPELLSTIEKLSVFLPGPLSIVLPKNKDIAEIVSGGLDSIAVRFPSNECARILIKKAQVPIAAPSANLSTYVSPTTAQHVYDSFGDKLSMILDDGACEYGIESTILSLIEDKPRLLRPGSIAIEELEKVLGDINVSVQPQVKKILAPGMFPKHYSPQTKIVLQSEFNSTEYPEKTGFICFSNKAKIELEEHFTTTSLLSPTGDLDEVAKGLFAAIREQDNMDLDLIVVESCPEHGIGRAIMDRLRRASA